MSPEHRAYLVKAHARHLGFDAVGIADLSPPPHGDRLAAWLQRGMAGNMAYMHRQAAKRHNPASIVPGTNYAVVVTKNYYNPDPPHQPGTGRVAKYARGRDYHTVLREPLRRLADYISSLGGAGTIAAHYVDAGPVPERELAQRAGIGWIAKNTMLIDPVRGSYFFLASVLTNLALATDPPFEADRCGSCRRCLDACPTAAFPEPHVLDSRRCISYLTIEHTDAIPRELTTLMDDWVFGCDVCQDVCPWNIKFARPADDPALDIDPGLAQLDLESLTTISEADFRERYGWTPLERPGAKGMHRNATIAMRNLRRQTSALHTS